MFDGCARASAFLDSRVTLDRSRVLIVSSRRAVRSVGAQIHVPPRRESLPAEKRPLKHDSSEDAARYGGFVCNRGIMHYAGPNDFPPPLAGRWPSHAVIVKQSVQSGSPPDTYPPRIDRIMNNNVCKTLVGPRGRARESETSSEPARNTERAPRTRICADLLSAIHRIHREIETGIISANYRRRELVAMMPTK
jgi:hypothetical protein